MAIIPAYQIKLSGVPNFCIRITTTNLANTSRIPRSAKNPIRSLAITVPLKGICRIVNSTAARENWYTQNVATSLPAGIFNWVSTNHKPMVSPTPRNSTKITVKIVRACAKILLVLSIFPSPKPIFRNLCTDPFKLPDSTVNIETIPPTRV